MSTSIDANRAFRTYVEAVLRARDGLDTVIASPAGNVIIMSEEKYN